MPRNLVPCVLVVVAGCVFHADYDGGRYTCTDGKCPSGLACSTGHVCLPADAAPPDTVVDAGGDAAPDAPPPALTCADPGAVPGSGSTAGRSSLVSASCAGFVMNGADAVYRVTAAAGDTFLVTVSGLEAYAIAPCSPTPATPACLGNVLATPGNPSTFTATTAGAYYVVVDHHNPATSGAYTLSVAKQ